MDIQFTSLLIGLKRVFRIYDEPEAYGDTCYRKDFLFLPKIINGRMKWLTCAKWMQRADGKPNTAYPVYNIKWYDECWIEE